mmetsp:Transcript_8100/g.18949  ORF Transcript_8100/g.18949 Transcript_8100/m.18949 type:complete len:297 (+) Transcript_8100:49-939(+)
MESAVDALRRAAPAGSHFGPNFSRLVGEFCHVSCQKLLIISDFDQTLTSYTGRDGLPGEQCHGIMLKHLDTTPLPEVSKVFRELEEWERMTEPERMAKCNHDPAQRKAATTRWFKSFHEVSSHHQLSNFAHECLTKSNVTTRGNLNATFQWMNKWSVPLFVISAGIRELIVPILERDGVLLPHHARLLANSLDEAEVRVTSRNKSESLAQIGDFACLAEGRTHAVLLGDKPSDCAPLAGLSTEVTVLKIAFLNSPSDAMLDEYLSHFDVILLGDPSMHFVNVLLEILSASAGSPRL